MDYRWIIAVLVVIALALGAAFFLRNPAAAPVSETPARMLKTFYNEKYGIALNYPENYKVEERDAAGEGTPRHTLVFADEAALASVPAQSEGPPSITIDIFANPQNDGAEKWIKGSNFSNYKISPDGTLTATSVAGEAALAYGWDGLYRSNSIVLNYKKQIFMLSVGYNSPEDQIVKDFAAIVASVQFDP